MEIDPIIPGDESGDSDEAFDRAIWKDKQEILQTFDMSVRSLQRWRDDGIRMRKYKKKYFYHIRDAEQLFKNKNKKKEKLAKWPISWLWTGFWVIETILLFATKGSIPTLLNMAVPIIIAVPASIIIRIRKRREKK
jgi:DNA repair photolyase